MGDAARHLRVVDAETGEWIEHDDELARVEAELEETTRKLRGAWLQIRKLESDIEAYQRAHPRHAEVEEVHARWQGRCGHPRADLDYGKTSRFAAWLWALERYGREMVERAIEGAAFDPWTKRARNGHVERFDDPVTICKNARNFESHVNRAPRGCADA